MTSKPQVMIIGTGGTIAGQAGSATDLAYDAATLSVDDLLRAIPSLNDIADISSTNLFSLNSKDIGPREWLELARCVENHLKDENVSGVVVTHGTDTLEEAALFLDLTLSSQKPVVMTGSMRAATALGADGSANLYQAVQVTVSENASGRGVLVVMNGEIFSGSRIIKGHSLATNAFSGTVGLVGSAYNRHTYFFVPSGASPLSGRFRGLLKTHQGLPDIAVFYVVAGGQEPICTFFETVDCPGLVVAGFGSGEIPRGLIPRLNVIAKRGTPIVVSSRVNYPVVLPETMTLEEKNNIVASRHFNPQKSAVLLSLCLAAGVTPLDVFASAELGA